MNLLVLDTETTGVDAERNEVVEIACQHYKDGIKLSEFQVKIFRSGKKETNMGALRVNRYNLSATLSDGYEERSTAARLLVQYLVSLPGDRQNPITVCGHNTAFDVVGIKKFLANEGYTGWGDLFSYSVADTSTTGNMLREAGIINLERMSLGALAKTLGIDVDKTKTHGAMYDTELTAQCYFKMLKLLKELNLDANNMRTIMSLEEKDVHG